MEFILNKYKNAKRPEDLATRRYFEEYPDSKWEWVYDFIDLIQKNKPNEGHKAILELQEHWALNGVKCTLVTQNIDNYHCQLIKSSKVLKTSVYKEGSPGFGFTDNVNEIHGNLCYMRCFEEWDKAMYYIPPRPKDPEDLIPKWTKCGGVMRPHILWFDESYTEELHKVKTVTDLLPTSKSEAINEEEEKEPKVDALIVIGTALATTLANNIVYTCIVNNVLTVEINMEPVWEQGRVLQVLTKSEISLPKLVNSYIECFNDKKSESSTTISSDSSLKNPTKISKNK